MSSRATVLAAVLVTTALALGALLGATIAGDNADPRPNDAVLAQATEKAARLEAERNRLRQERNQLEARLAAGNGPQACPDEFVSTGTLLRLYSVDYPCAWHVLFDPTAPVTAEDRPGLRAEVLLVSGLPISLAPGGGPAGDLELVDWTDDPNDDQDALPPLTEWLDEERARFTTLQSDDQFEAGDGLTVHRLVGVQEIFDEPSTVHVLLWRYDDAIGGTRHIARAFALEPSARAATALERLARSFRARQP